MKKPEIAWHVLLCLLIGGALAYATPAKWLAATFWVSAAMNLSGALAVYEDAVPGGFDNPEGTDTPEFTKGMGAFKYTVHALGFTTFLAGIGFLIQWYI